MNVVRIAFGMLALGVVAAGCHAALSLDDLELVDSTTTTPGGTGGSGLTGGGGTGGTGGSGLAGGGGSGGGACDPDACPTDPTGCKYPICTDGACDFGNEPIDKVCTDSLNADAKVCDGDGNCVECNDVDDCANPTQFQCVGHECIPQHCFNGQVDAGETGRDCGGTTGCPPCANGEGCLGRADCLSHYCNGTTCAACSAGDCPSDGWCNTDNNGGTCESDKIDGAPCEIDDECLTDICFTAGATNGVCCNETCWGGANDHCRSCFNVDTDQGDGLCADIGSGRDPFGHCPEVGADCSGVTCDGTGTCILLNEGESCGTSSCAGEQLNVGTCDGSGCAYTAEDCPNGLACNGMSGSCWPSCSSDDQCRTGRWCHPQGGCPMDRTLGSYCLRDEQCQDGSDAAPHCVDGVCCDIACSGQCRACDIRRTGASNGTCAFVPARSDPDEECDGAATCCTGVDTSCTNPNPPCDDYRCDGTLPATVGCGSPPCPGSCTFVSGEHTCDVNCANGHCPNNIIQCPPGSNCIVNCSSNVGNSCQGKTIRCPAEHSCLVVCVDGPEPACINTTIVCSADGPCELTCGAGDACLGAEQICGAEDCITNCAGTAPGVNCGNSCIGAHGQCPSPGC